MAMTKVSEVTVGSGGAASISFTGIAGTGKDLLLLVSARIADNTIFNLTVNSNTSSVYSGRRLAGNGSSAFTASFSAASSIFAGYVPNDAAYTASTFSNNAIYFSNYASAANKSFSSDGVNEDNASTALAAIFAGAIADTNPITSIQLTPASGNFVQHTTASLYIIS